MNLPPSVAAILKGASPADWHREAAKRGLISPTTLLDALPPFKPKESWATWRAFLAALYALPMEPSEFDLYRRCTGRTGPPTVEAREADVIVGRRGGKDRIASLLALVMAACRDYSPYLAAGQRGTLPIIAADRKQSREIMSYLDGLFSLPMFKPMVESQTSEQIRLNNRVTIEIHTASFRSTRGYTLIGAICNEIAFWRNEDSKNPDEEIIKAIRPGMASIPGAKLILLSSPYARRGVLWDQYCRYWGQDGDVLVWKADTLTMHPGNPQIEAEVARAYREDETAAKAEYGAEFRSDIEAFVPIEVVEAATDFGTFERPPDPALTYYAFVDVSGGTSDSFGLAIGHFDGGRIELDALREWPAPFEPDECVKEAAVLCKTYQIHQVQGDRYGGEWPRERFRVHGLTYFPSDRPKSDLYRDFLPLINSGQARLIDHPKLRSQLVALDRRVARGGRDSIDHQPGAHDDLANVTAGVCVWAAMLKRERRVMPTVYANTAEERRAMIRELVRPRTQPKIRDPYGR